MATNVFIHGVGQVTGEAKTDIELLSSSDLVSEITSFPFEGVFYEVDKDALNQYYAAKFGVNSGLSSSDFDSINSGIVASDQPMMYIKDLVTSMTTDSTGDMSPDGNTVAGGNYSGANQKFKVLVNDAYDHAKTTAAGGGGYTSATTRGDGVVGLRHGDKLYNFIDKVKEDVQRIFGSAFDISALDGSTTLNQFGEDFSATSNSILSHQEVAHEILNNFITSSTASVTDLRIENVEELQQMVDSSDSQGHEFDNHFEGGMDNSTRTLTSLFIDNDIFRFQAGVKFTLTIQIPDYNPKEIYTSTNNAISGNDH